MQEFEVVLSIKDLLAAVEEELYQHPRLELIDLYKLCYQAWFGPAHITTDLVAVSSRIIEEIKTMRHVYRPLLQDIGNKRGFSRFSLSWFARSDPETKQTKSALLAELMLLTAPLGRKDLSIKQLWPLAAPLIKELYPGTPDAWDEVNSLASQELLPHHSQLFIENYHPHYRVIHHTISEQIIDLMS